jgi:hypothetical protein
MGQIDKITIGVADLYYTPPGGGVEVYLGLTKGGGEFNYEADWHDINEIDQFGTTIVDSILIGEKASYKTNVVDTSLVAIKRVAPTASDADGQALTFGQRPGLRMQPLAGRLRIHPVSAGFNDKSRDVIIYKAGSKTNLNLQYKLDSEWVVPCEWAAYPDEERPLGDQLFRIGDESAVLPGPTKRLINFYLTPSNPTITVAQTQAFSANAVYEDGTTEDVTDECVWTSSKETVLTISNAGSGEGIGAGIATVTATYGGYTTSTTVTVS